MLIQFQRHDNGGPVLINPAHVSAVFAHSEYPDVVVVRGPDGRGLLVSGTVDTVIGQLRVALGPTEGRPN